VCEAAGLQTLTQLLVAIKQTVNSPNQQGFGLYFVDQDWSILLDSGKSVQLPRATSTVMLLRSPNN
jgi:hypothetical protein